MDQNPQGRGKAGGLRNTGDVSHSLDVKDVGVSWQDGKAQAGAGWTARADVPMPLTGARWNSSTGQLHWRPLSSTGLKSSCVGNTTLESFCLSTLTPINALPAHSKKAFTSSVICAGQMCVLQVSSRFSSCLFMGFAGLFQEHAMQPPQWHQN